MQTRHWSGMPGILVLPTSITDTVVRTKEEVVGSMDRELRRMQVQDSCREEMVEEAMEDLVEVEVQAAVQVVLVVDGQVVWARIMVAPVVVSPEGVGLM
jgi:hypothetical protein